MLFPHHAVARTALALGTAAVIGVLVGPGSAYAAHAHVGQQTVLVGGQPVAVSSAGTVTVNGQTIPIVPGAKEVVTITPPAGSTPIQEGGQTSYQLPNGATGESFSVSSSAVSSGATSIPSTAVYSAAPTPSVRRAHAVPHTALGWGCLISASAPSQIGGTTNVKGYAFADACTDPVQLSLTATLWWEDYAGTAWQNQNQNSATGVGYVQDSATHSCTPGTQHFWHMENQTIGYYNGVEAAGTVNSPNAFFQCVG